jgi:hypothetical protein
VAELKDNLNTMIDNLRLTTDRNTEQDWLKTNLARFTGMLRQGQRDRPRTVGRNLLLSELTPLVNAHQGVIYRTEGRRGQLRSSTLVAAFADDGKNGHPPSLRIGEGCSGNAPPTSGAW